MQTWLNNVINTTASLVFSTQRSNEERSYALIPYYLHYYIDNQYYKYIKIQSIMDGIVNP